MLEKTAEKSAKTLSKINLHSLLYENDVGRSENNSGRGQFILISIFSEINLVCFAKGMQFKYRQ